MEWTQPGLQIYHSGTNNMIAINLILTPNPVTFLLSLNKHYANKISQSRLIPSTHTNPKTQVSVALKKNSSVHNAQTIRNTCDNAEIITEIFIVMQYDRESEIKN